MITTSQAKVADILLENKGQMHSDEISLASEFSLFVTKWILASLESLGIVTRDGASEFYRIKHYVSEFN